MGDRGQIIVEQRGERQFLYSHWTGYQLPQVVQSALTRAGLARSTDAPYLARIIFNEMTKGDEMSETGFGIWPTSCDHEHPAIHLDCDTQEVYITSGGDGTGAEMGRASMKEFADQGLAALGLTPSQGGWE